MNEFTRMEEEIKKLFRKIQNSIYFFAFLFLIIAVRLWHLQIYQGPDLRRYSENNRLKKQTLQAPRGLILSRDKKILVNNYLEYELILTPQYSKNTKQISRTLAPLLSIPPQIISKKIQDSTRRNGLFFPVSLKRPLNLEQIYRLKLLKESFPEISIREYIVRSYPFKSVGAHLFGYTGEISREQIEAFNTNFKGRLYFKPGDQIGKQGLESAWEEELKGIDGVSFVEVDAHGRHTPAPSNEFWNLEPKKPTSGYSLLLTLDMDIQQAAFKAMNRKDKIGPRTGAVVAMKLNGEILAWISSPSFDPNLFSKILSGKNWSDLAKDSKKPLLNRVIKNHYPPGSTVKPFIALAALQEELIQPDTLIYSPARIRLGRRVFHDHNQTDYGHINLFSAMEQSSNTFFYQLGEKLGVDQMTSYMSHFGLGKKTQTRMKGEISGFLPTTKWKIKTLKEQWQKGEDLIHAIGQGYTLTTPLQIAAAYNAIASKGLVMRPFIVQAVLDSENKEIKKFSSLVVEDLKEKIDQKHFSTVITALSRVTNGALGTARWWKLKNKKTMAGKTGTSQVRSFNRQHLYTNCMNKPLEDRHHGWFAAFAPVEDPEITVVVLAENSCAGSSGAVPIARDIINAYFKKYGAAPAASDLKQKPSGTANDINLQTTPKTYSFLTKESPPA